MGRIVNNADHAGTAPNNVVLLCLLALFYLRMLGHNRKTLTVSMGKGPGALVFLLYLHS